MIAIIPCETAQQIASTYDVMKQLRPHLVDAASYVGMVQGMFAEGYKLVGAFDGDRCCGVMGYRAETRLFCGHMIYVDDLVTDETQRSRGVGKALMDWLKGKARRLKIKTVQLDSGTHRHSAHKFYLREGFHIAAFNFRLAVD